MPPISKHRTHTQNKKKNNSRGLVRIIAGKHRGRRLPVLMHEGLRPTSDRVKETLFNWLMLEINQSRCLDLFAGSGSLGIEALSRGAGWVDFVEADQSVAKKISTNLQTLREQDNSRLTVGDALTMVEGIKSPYDIVFIDPPFGKELVERVVDGLINKQGIKDEGFIYIESGHSDSYQLPKELIEKKHIKTSQVNATLYQLVLNP